tara:strand:- start:1759 stop:2115 length:357 start_codon:yes stop_codon:yes gene_type:complete
MMMTKSDDSFLDDLFDAAQAQAPVVPDDLMARVLIDAQRAQAVQITAPKLSLFAGFLDMIGGWPSVGGLAMAGVAGLWFGVAPPQALSIWTAELIGTPVTVDLFGDTNAYFTEALIDG